MYSGGLQFITKWRMIFGEIKLDDEFIKPLAKTPRRGTGLSWLDQPLGWSFWQGEDVTAPSWPRFRDFPPFAAGTLCSCHRAGEVEEAVREGAAAGTAAPRRIRSVNPASAASVLQPTTSAPGLHTRSAQGCPVPAGAASVTSRWCRPESTKPSALKGPSLGGESCCRPRL